jgi:hypothetical protein
MVGKKRGKIHVEIHGNISSILDLLSYHNSTLYNLAEQDPFDPDPLKSLKLSQTAV